MKRDYRNSRTARDGFSGGFVSNHEDHSILLQGVDLIGSFSTDQQIIQDLLNKGKLITD